MREIQNITYMTKAMAPNPHRKFNNNMIKPKQVTETISDKIWSKVDDFWSSATFGLFDKVELIQNDFNIDSAIVHETQQQFDKRIKDLHDSGEATKAQILVNQRF